MGLREQISNCSPSTLRAGAGLLPPSPCSSLSMLLLPYYEYEAAHRVSPCHRAHWKPCSAYNRLAGSRLASWIIGPLELIRVNPKALHPSGPLLSSARQKPSHNFQVRISQIYLLALASSAMKLVL